MRSAVRPILNILVITICAGRSPAQAPLTRFFVLPDTGPAPLSDSLFQGIEGTTPYAFDFAEDIRFNRGGYVTLSQDAVNTFVWNVVDFKLPGMDLALGSAVTFQRPATAGPHGTWTSSDPGGFPNLATVSVSMTGILTTTGPIAGVFPPTDTLTMTGTIVPGYFHSVILLTGSFAGISGGTIALYMKKDFYPPAVTWEMVVRSATSNATPTGAPSPSPVQGGFTMQRGVANPNVYAVLGLYLEVTATPAVVISIPAAPTAGSLTFDPGTRGLTGALNVLVDGTPATLAVDGTGEGFTGCVMHPTTIVIDEPTGCGTLASVHLELSTSELVPPDPLINDFQIGVTTSLVMRGRAGHIYGCAASFSALPGINTSVGDIPVMPDDLLWLSIDPLNPFFSNMIGLMPAAGEVLISVAIPNDPILIGAVFFLGGGTFDPATLAVLAATNSHRAIVK